jgi:hypothetical protein
MFVGDTSVVITGSEKLEYCHSAWSAIARSKSVRKW